jgi:CBS domain-containing protein
MEGKTLVGIVSALDIARIVSEKGLSGKTGIAPELPTTDKQSPWLTK